MKINLLSLFFLLGVFLSCSIDESKEFVEYRTEKVIEVNAPSSGQVDEPVEIEVKFAVYNGCGKFDKFIESGSERSKVIEVQAKYEGSICTQDIPIITVLYEFTPSTPGEYQLKFKSGETDHITVNVTVTE